MTSAANLDDAPRRRRAKKSQQAPANSPIHAPTPDDPRDLAALLSYGSSSLPFTQAWTDNRVEQVRSYKHWVFIAIRAIARKIASQIPNVTYVHDSRSLQSAAKSRILSPHARTKALTPLLAHQQLEPVADDHPLLRLLLDPNDPDTYYDLIFETLLYLSLTGVAYWWAPKEPVLGLPAALWALPSHWVWPITGRDTAIEAWEIRPVEGSYLRRRIPADEIVVFREKNPISKIDGYSPLTAGAQWTDILTMTNTARWHAYQNGTFPTVAVQFDGTYNDPTDEDLRRIEAKFIARYSGPTRSNKPLFLPPGVKATPLNLKVSEMVFGETAKETRDNILALYGVPPVVAGLMEGLTYGSLQAAMVGWYNITINPILRFLGQIITEKLARVYDPTLKVWWEDASPDDPEMLEEQLKTDLMYGARTPNEVRLLRGLQPYPKGWGDQPIAPVNMQILPLGGDSSHLPQGQAAQPSLSDKE